ncbi:MAG: serine/threonine protein kinase [Chloroflexi bacterium]|nr:serine/threonine protein kinase [Chloroflexota bacterium]
MQTDPLVGRQIGAFRVEEKIGQGGMASVYRAYQPSVDRSIALKVISLDPTQGVGEEFRRRFEQEARLIATLEHIHILPIYDYGIVDAIAFIAPCACCAARNAVDRLAHGPLEVNNAADLLMQIARGLNYAHHHGVLHRDLKPSNILLDDAGNAFLSDFGLAKLIEDPLSITKTDTIVGTPAYVARSSSVAKRWTPAATSTAWASSSTMLTGRAPSRPPDNNVVSIIYQHLEKTPDLPSSINRISLRPRRRCAYGDGQAPDDRYSSAVELAADVNSALGRSTSTGSFRSCAHAAGARPNHHADQPR